MKMPVIIFLVLVTTVLSLWFIPFEAAAKETDIHGNPVISSAYSPYRTIEVKAEVTGKIKTLPVEEGETLKPGSPLLIVDVPAREEQEQVLRKTMDQLIREEGILKETAALRKKCYQRYLRLFQTQKISEQSLDNIRLEWLASMRALVRNRQEQLRLRSDMITTADILRKARPIFPVPMYISKIYVEPYEMVNTGQPLARIMDLSRARLRLVMDPDMFRSLASRFRNGDRIPFTLIPSDGRHIELSGTVERLREDRDSDYLYSYSLDLVFNPQPGLLWGEVVQVRLRNSR